MNSFDHYQEITDKNWRSWLYDDRTDDGGLEVLPRQNAYGTNQAADDGFVPIGEYSDLLIPEDEWKERIQAANAAESLPYHHWVANKIPITNQSYLPYCWAFGATSCMELLNVRQGYQYERLAPTSLAWMVDYRMTGWYPYEVVKGIAKRGIASPEFVPDLSINPVGTPARRRRRKRIPASEGWKDGWQEDAMRNRLTKFYDTNYETERGMLQQVVSLLLSGCPCYVAHNWWSHALCIIGLIWDEKARYNVKLVHLNSHNDGIVVMSGHRGIPDECYGLAARTIGAAL